MVLTPQELTEAVPGPLKGYLRTIYRRVVMLNYRHEIWPSKHAVEEARFRTYSLVDLYGGSRDDKLLKLMLEESEEGDTIYDIGANAGLYSLSLLSAVPDSRVVAFEPNPKTSGWLEKNAALNGLSDRIQVYQLGLSDRNGKRDLYLSRKPYLSFFSEVSSSFKHDNASRDVLVGRRESETVRLDDLRSRENIPVPDRVKIDVQGEGPEVLKGATETLQKYRPVVYYEPHTDSSGGLRKNEVMEIIDSIGYSLEETETGLGYFWVIKPEGKR